eukprot:1179589-Prorocentrum_minimum.AAC.1
MVSKWVVGFQGARGAPDVRAPGFQGSTVGGSLPTHLPQPAPLAGGGGERGDASLAHGLREPQQVDRTAVLQPLGQARVQLARRLAHLRLSLRDVLVVQLLPLQVVAPVGRRRGAGLGRGGRPRPPGLVGAARQGARRSARLPPPGSPPPARSRRARWRPPPASPAQSPSPPVGRAPTGGLAPACPPPPPEWPEGNTASQQVSKSGAGDSTLVAGDSTLVAGDSTLVAIGRGRPVLPAAQRGASCP